MGIPQVTWLISEWDTITREESSWCQIDALKRKWANGFHGNRARFPLYCLRKPHYLFMIRKEVHETGRDAEPQEKTVPHKCHNKSALRRHTYRLQIWTEVVIHTVVFIFLSFCLFWSMCLMFSQAEMFRRFCYIVLQKNPKKYSIISSITLTTKLQMEINPNIKHLFINRELWNSLV